jgi:hypothetical protein
MRAPKTLDGISATAIVDYRRRDSREIADPAASQKTVSGERIGALAV